MQVRKFEAKTMKEALELVKVHLGPEAIILSAKDSKSGFGLMGNKSVEVTAAVSEETLRKKKIAESKLREDLRERFQRIPASKQKEFINKIFTEPRQPEMSEASPGHVLRREKESSPPRQAISHVRYIDINDDETRTANEHRAPQGKERKTRAEGHDVDVRTFASQVAELKSLVARFQQIPQMPLTLHPGAELGLSFELSPAYQRLTQQGVHAQLVTQMLKRAQKELNSEILQKPALIESWIVAQLLNSIEVSKTPALGRYHIFFGSTGQGKTSSLVKFASKLVMQEKKTIAMISLDTIKVGAADQLRIYAQILNVPFAIVRSPVEWQVARHKLSHIDHVLVDFPGFTLHSGEELDWLRRMLPPAEFDRRLHYVQSLLARDEDALALAGRYQGLGFHDVIFTRLDESSRQGLLLNFQERFRVPFHSFGNGPQIPEDYEYASKERVIDLLFKMAHLSNLHKEDIKE